MISLAWRFVMCASCGRRYRCTPADDYYNATCTTDGVCFGCLTARAEWSSSRVVIADAHGNVLDHGEDA